MIGIITYDKPHRKTQDLIFQMIINGFIDLNLIVIPWVERKNFSPIYKHRPSKCPQVSIDDLSSRIGIGFSRVKVEDLGAHCKEKAYEHILIAGAGLLPDSLSKSQKVINAHPGYLPYSKGLDAFKWAILNEHPLGVTTHYISDKPDEGQLIEKRKVPVFFEDSFGALAQRIYETEIEMLVNAVKVLNQSEAPLTDLSDNRYNATRRMPHNQEIIMMDRFESLRRKSESIKNQKTE